MDDTQCPPDDTDNRQRTRYIFGKLLTTEDFEREQEYHRAALRRHNLELHGWGVARGFDVVQSSPGAAAVSVSPGYALDPCGREILLTNQVTVPITMKGVSIIAARATEAAVGDDIVRDDVEVAIVPDACSPWVVLASVTSADEVVVDESVRRLLSLD
jgi:hypothetical protein